MTDIRPNHTLYVNNLNSKVNKAQMKKALYNLFISYGRLLGIVAMKSPKMRGQAFIIFDDVQNSTAALRSLQGLEFFEKPLRLQYAKKDSESIQRIRAQENAAAAALAAAAEKASAPKKPRIEKPQPPVESTLQQQHVAMMNSAEVLQAAEMAAAVEAELEQLPLKERQRRIQTAIAAQSTLIGTLPMIPEQPSNSTLFLSNLPNETTKEMLEILFKQFTGYRDVRLIQGREGIAFVDFDKDNQATIAKDALQNFKVTPTNPISISFAKK
ncbi:unnamed protein product [Didymodactylos carnosus]|uniref:RRM domain-containing protein n=1 Tax=Didymodactylos carnosus TaxID=1234261 RepID=A0A814HU19_9BILA|nr:unnamed protein product [Didymodactylos carnosus]CAF1015299.1 unnamed protein product [Didymodactylos carnosus]CAF3784371.1 unnamed protein product [Didymodactylos carnosus]CAF3786490.1 unnamed protein product [Didymodactylos carnosus]